jgi:putative phosphoribosyl transferase
MKDNVKEETVKISSGDVAILGNLSIPQNATGIVVFAHGSGSSRLSPRNIKVARRINEVGMATLLIDLLTEEEEAADMYSGEYRFNIDMLAQRLADATEWITNNPTTKKLMVGYFGASTGAAAALIASTKLTEFVKAVVSRGGRPDLAGAYLPSVKAPTLLIVGGDDTQVIELNKEAKRHITAPTKIAIVPGATHLFEEPGKLDQVAKLAIDWFSQYLQ